MLKRKNDGILTAFLIGKYENPKIVDKDNLRAISEYLQKSDIEIFCGGYQAVLEKAVAGDFVYFDPPYAPMTKTANFASYLKGKPLSKCVDFLSGF